MPKPSDRSFDPAAALPGKLFVGGLAQATTERSLRVYFETFGEVTCRCSTRRRQHPTLTPTLTPALALAPTLTPAPTLHPNQVTEVLLPLPYPLTR